MANTTTVSLVGWRELELKLGALSQGIGADALQAAALSGAAPILAAMADAAPPTIPQNDIQAVVVAADVEHVEVDVSVTGSDDTLDAPAQASIKRAVDDQTEAAVAAIAAEILNALDRVTGT